MIRQCIQNLTGMLAITFVAQASAQTPVEIKLIAAIQEARGWCLDVRGAPGKTEPIGGLRSETCKMYSDNKPTEDQAFYMEDIQKNNQFRMVDFSDKCITLYEPAAGSFVSLETCDGRAAQAIKFHDTGHIIPEMMPELCLTISDLVMPGGGGRPLHLMRDVTFEQCDPAIDIRQTWEMRTEWTGFQETTGERPFIANPNARPPKGK